MLTLATEDSPWDDPSPDPPNNWDRPGSPDRVPHLPRARLNYPDKPAPDGFELEPEAAAAMPTVSADGRTYTFTIRPGLRVLTAIERAGHRRDVPVLDRAGALAGTDRLGPGAAVPRRYRRSPCLPGGTASGIEGLSAAGDRLTIELEAASPDFLTRLSLPFFCPVPIGTPAVRLGLDPDPPVAGTGPYYLAKHIRYRLIVLEKNPELSRRPAAALRCDRRPPRVIGVGHPRECAERPGRWSVAPGRPALVGSGGQLDLAWGPDSDAARAGIQRWFGAARFGTSYLALNPTRKAFKDVNVRRAVALALDRPALARIWPIQPATSLLPASIPTITEARVQDPDLERARSLMGGRTFTVTMAAPTEGDCASCDAFTNELTSQLQQIGITVRVHRSDDPWGDAMRPEAAIDIFDAWVGTEYADAGTLIRDLGGRGWIRPADAREIQRVEALTGQARVDGAVALDRRVVDDAVLVIPYGHETYSNYFSAGIGCAFVQPAIGAVDLLSLCREGWSGSQSPALGGTVSDGA